MRRRLAWSAALLVSFGVLAVALVAAALVAVSLGWQRERIVAELETRLGEALGSEVHIGVVSGPLLPRFVARDVRLGPARREFARVRRVSVRLHLDSFTRPERLVVDDLEIEGLELSLRRDETGWNLPVGPAGGEPGALPLAILLRQIRVSGSRVDLAWTQGASAASLVGGFDGRVADVRVPAEGPATWGAANFSLALEPSVLADARVSRGGFEAEVDAAHRLKLTGVVGGDFGEIGLQGRGDLDAWLVARSDPTTRVDLAFDGLDLAALSGGATPATRLVGRAELGVGARTGARGQPELVFVAALEDSRLGRVPLARAQLRGVLLDDAWQVESLSAEGEGLSLKGSAAGSGFDPEALDLQARIERLEDVFGWLSPSGDPRGDPAVAGSLSLDVQLARRGRGVGGRVAADARGLAWRGTSIGDVALRAQVLEGERAVLESLTLRGERLSLDVDRGAVLRWAGDGASDGVVVQGLRARSQGATLTADGRITADEVHGLHLQLTGLEASRIEAARDIVTLTAGRIDADLVLDGPLDELRAEGWLELHGGAVSVASLGETFSMIEGRVRLEDEVLVVERLTIGPPDARAALSGSIAVPGFRPGRADLRLRVVGFPLARVPLPGDLAGSARDAEPIAVSAAGRIDAELALDGPLDGSLDELRAEGWLELHGGAVRVPSLGETFSMIEGRVRLEDEVLVVERLTVGPPDARAALSGSIAVPGFRPGRADLRLRVVGFPLTYVPLPGDLAGSAPDAEPVAVSAGGRIDADLTLQGPLLAPAVAGDLDWSRPRWEDVQLERIVVHVEADESAVRGTMRVRYEGHEILVAEAQLPVPKNARKPIDWLRDDRARIELRGESLDFALLEPFLTRLVRDPRGTADLTLVVRGGEPEPQVDGVLTVADGSIRVPLLRQTFTPVSGVARFDGLRVSLESLSIGSPEAGLEAEGTLELVDLRPAQIDLSMRLADFPASRSALLTANVDGHVELKGPVGGPALTGELALRRTRVTLRSGTDPIAREVRVRTAERDDSLRERARSGPGLLDRASVDLALSVPGDTWIRSPELELDVEGWARLEKRSLEPVRLSGDLNTRRGNVRVVGKRFDLRRGNALLDGDSDPDPVLDVEATRRAGSILVVAYLTGRASNPEVRLESEPELPQDDVLSYLFFGRPASQLAASEQGNVSLTAAGLAAGMALDELRSTFGDALPIDTIDVRIEEGDQSRVEIGKYVAKDVFLRYGQTFGSEPVEEVGISYRINKNWRIESTTSSDATSGADLYWTIDY